MFEPVIPYLLTLAFALAAIGAMRRVRLWRRGQVSPVAFWQGLAAMPRRYLVDLHHVVARDKYMSNTHVATGGGLCWRWCWWCWCTAWACTAPGWYGRCWVPAC
ncbi:DUF3483 domain-containing protein [Oceanimonas sp. NS1]|nr:DUF3483 domain-containing protein [Oceanimonas sp. NS1]